MVILIGLLYSCKKDDDTKEEENTGKIILNFTHRLNGDELIVDSTMYVNAAGNDYMVTELQYFISDVKLYNSDGTIFMIKAWDDIHYVDNDISSTMKWEVYDDIPVGSYNSISFTFGINEEKNQSLMFNNPPESFMFWPEVLGGGYHYLKLNGKWTNDTMLQNRPFEFHLGIGQIYSGDSAYVPDIIGFVQNYFEVNLPNSSFNIEKDKTKEIQFIMNIENWFQNPHIYDHGDYAENTMQCQEAIQKGCENGKEDVFSISYKNIKRNQFN